MLSSVNSFLYKATDIHSQRAKKIMHEYPEIRSYIAKKNPYTFLIILLATTLHITCTYFMQYLPLYMVFLTAFFVGTVFNSCFFALVHECSHHLIFKKKKYNILAGVVVNIPMFIPSSVSFEKYHRKHHTQMGNYDIDADLPSQWEAKLVKNIWYRKLIWLFFFPIIQSIRTMRIPNIQFFDFLTVLNFVSTISFNVFVYSMWGLNSFIYLGVSFFMAFGFSIVGGRIIQEHFIFDTEALQETYSYYGWLSAPSLYVSYHNEHHDFPVTSWNNLPKIHKIAKPYYDSLSSYTSWTKLVFQFIFNNQVSLYNRIIRS